MLKPIERPISFFADGLELSGMLHLPEQNPTAVVIGCHGLQADKNSPKQIELASRCTAANMAYFRFDHRGCGQSQGVFESETTLKNRESDLVAAAGAVSDVLGEDLPRGLFGSSLGGTVCLKASNKISPFAMVTLAAPVQSSVIRIPEDSPQSLKNEILRHRLRFDITTNMAPIDHIMIIHGSEDEIVGVGNAHRIYRIAREPKVVLIIENGDHRISRKSHQEQFMKNAVQWFSDCCTKQFSLNR